MAGRNVIDKLGMLILVMETCGDCVCQCEEFGNHQRCLGFGTRRMLMMSASPVSQLEASHCRQRVTVVCRVSSCAM